MKRTHAATPLALFLLLAACRAQPTSVPPQTPVRLHLTFSTARGAAAVVWNVTVERDGYYEVLSGFDSGTTVFENECEGTRPVAEVEPWFVLLQERASASERPSPVERGRLRISVGVDGPDGARRYLDPADVPEELAAWLEVFTDC